MVKMAKTDFFFLPYKTILKFKCCVKNDRITYLPTAHVWKLKRVTCFGLWSIEKSRTPVSCL